MFWKTGTSVMMFNIEGNTPDKKERLTRSANNLEISYFRTTRFLLTLYGLADIFLYREDMIIAVSSLLIAWWNEFLYYHLDWQNNVFNESTWFCLCFFSNGSEIIAKSVSNIAFVVISVRGSNIISRKSSRNIWTFLKLSSFFPPSFFHIIPAILKIFFKVFSVYFLSEEWARVHNKVPWFYNSYDVKLFFRSSCI